MGLQSPVSAFPTFQLVQTLEKRSLDIAGGRLCTGDADASLLSLSCLINKRPARSGSENPGSPGRTRTYNSAVNSRVLYH